LALSDRLDLSKRNQKRAVMYSRIYLSTDIRSLLISALATNNATDVLYIRFVALSPGNAPGTVKTNYSKVVKVNYGDYECLHFKYFAPPEVKKIDANIPQVKLLEYEPIQWEYFDWMYWYEVVRQPTYKEYFTFIPQNQLPLLKMS
jgi:hypothetical protein